MAVWTFFDSFAERQLNGNAIDLDTDTIKLAIITSATTPLPATHDFWNDLQSSEVSDTSANYTAGGETVAVTAISAASNAADVIATAGSVTWSQDAVDGFTNGKHFILYKDIGTPGSSPLICFATYSGTLDLTAGDITLTFGASGKIFTLTY